MASTRVTISIVHDDGRAIDWLGPVDLSELKAEKTFKQQRGRESLSENHTFVLWLDNANPKLVVLSMVRKIPEGDVTNACYRFIVQVQDGDSLAKPIARPGTPPGERPASTIVGVAGLAQS
mgnify:CR=1 FL=1